MSTDGVFEVGLWTFRMAPDCQDDFDFDWSEWLADIEDALDGDPVITATTVTEVNTQQVNSPPDTVNVMVSSAGLVHGDVGYLKCAITTAAGRQDARTYRILIRDR